MRRKIIRHVYLRVLRAGDEISRAAADKTAVSRTNGKPLRANGVLTHRRANIGQTTAVSMKFRPGTALNCYGNFAPYLTSAPPPAPPRTAADYAIFTYAFRESRTSGIIYTPSQKFVCRSDGGE